MKLKQIEALELHKQYEMMAKKKSEMLKNLNIRKKEYSTIKSLNINMKKMIINLIKTKEEK